ncbi:hypothetical protein HK100_007964 [Physocladia obscura]|uniref:Ankyrin repeat protein n=1 Tax=Physocladia obscura TaxID=109957 RepID=A0AAD5XER7_9FUNG|nr:hypothetical protein HK100_007964 [Physocladia obscura]
MLQSLPTEIQQKVAYQLSVINDGAALCVLGEAAFGFILHDYKNAQRHLLRQINIRAPIPMTLESAVHTALAERVAGKGGDATSDWEDLVDTDDEEQAYHAAQVAVAGGSGNNKAHAHPAAQLAALMDSYMNLPPAYLAVLFGISSFWEAHMVSTCSGRVFQVPVYRTSPTYAAKAVGIAFASNPQFTIDPKMWEWACLCGFKVTVGLLFAHEKKLNAPGLASTAVRGGNVDILTMVLGGENDAVALEDWQWTDLLWAAAHADSVDVFKFIFDKLDLNTARAYNPQYGVMADPKNSTVAFLTDFLTLAIVANSGKVTAFLLKHPKLVFLNRDQERLFLAKAFESSADLSLVSLLNDPRFTPTPQNKLFDSMVRFLTTKRIEEPLKMLRVVLDVSKQLKIPKFMFKRMVENENFAMQPGVVRMLAEEGGFDLGWSNNLIFRSAVKRGVVDTVKSLLQLASQVNINPAALSNEALKGAHQRGQREIVELLLGDVQINPKGFKTFAEWQANVDV